MRIAHPSDFSSVDAVDDPAAFAVFLDVVGTCQGVGHGRAFVADALALGPGSTVLDLGCGPGDETVELARRVVPGGRAVGVDLSQAMIDEARRRAVGVDVPATFEVGDAQALPFTDDAFDACRAERMLTHVADTCAVLAEMARVTRPGGRVAVIDADVESFLIDSPDRAVTRMVVSSFADGLRNGWVGRQLPRLMRDVPLTSLTVEPYVVSFSPEVVAALLDAHVDAMIRGGAPDGQLSRWRAELDASACSSAYMTFLAVVGVKP